MCRLPCLIKQQETASEMELIAKIIECLRTIFASAMQPLLKDHSRNQDGVRVNGTKQYKGRVPI